MNTISSSISAKASIIKDDEAINYGLRIQENSESLLAIPDEWDIFISHASAGKTAYQDEKEFVLFLYELLTVKYKKRVYLDLKNNPTMIDFEITKAAQRSKHGVFICSFRYVSIYNGIRPEPYITEFDRIPREINLFLANARWKEKYIIPVRFGLEERAYEERGPFPGTYTISIEDEINKSSIEKAEIVARKVIEKIEQAILTPLDV